MIRKAMPAAKLTTLRNAIRTRNPARLSERCGVSIAENSVGGSSYGLLGVIGGQYSLNHGKKDDARRAEEEVRPEEIAGEESRREGPAGRQIAGRQSTRQKSARQNQTLDRG